MSVPLGVLVACVVSISPTAAGTQTPVPNVGEASKAFAQEYRAYQEALQLDDKEYPNRSASYGPHSYTYLYRISQLGAGVLPDLMEKMGETKDISLNLPVLLITKKGFTKQEWRAEPAMDSRGQLRLYLNWWKTGRKSTAQLFAERDSEWQALRAQGKQSESQGKLAEIRSLGIAGLPLIMRELSRGRPEFIPVISRLSDGAVDPKSSPSECLSWWENHRDKFLVPFPNGRPTAKIGPARTVLGGEMVRFDGSASEDPDGDDLSYRWTQTAGPTVPLSDPTGASPTFAAPPVDHRTVLVFQLVVDDAGDLSKNVPTPNSKSEPVTVTVTVEPKK